MRYLLIIISAIFLFVSGCKKDTENPVEMGKITFVFKHLVNDNPLQVDTMKYVNAAGNHYLLSEIQYFISDVILHKQGGNILIDEWKDIYYIDTDIESTQSWQVFDDIPAANYDQISFTFGINEQKNQSLMFVDPPESLMFWPEYLGGGYHYMKLNGKWLADDQQVKPFNFHLGIGQNYGYPGNIIGFIQNYFTVTLPASAFEIKRGKTTTIEIIMNVDQWFIDPNTYNHDFWGGDIMQKQDAMKEGCENGHNVFSVGDISIN